jgi:hypothetical protein
VSWNVSNPKVTSSHVVISLIYTHSCAFVATSIIPSINAIHASVLFSASCANVSVQTTIICMVLTRVLSISAGAYDVDAAVTFFFDQWTTDKNICVPPSVLPRVYVRSKRRRIPLRRHLRAETKHSSIPRYVVRSRMSVLALIFLQYSQGSLEFLCAFPHEPDDVPE